MKIITQNQSRFLSRDDLDTPLVVTMDHVTEDATLRNPQVLHFASANRLKPLPMNVTNRRILVAAYGDDPAAWHGRPVEVYFNPSIPNPRNPAQPGGICVRIPPAAVAVQPGPAARQAAPPKPAPPPPPLIQRLERLETDDARLRDLACERLRKGLGFIEELIGAAARDRNDPGPASGPFFNLGGITPERQSAAAAAPPAHHGS